jgi:citrate lyase subunit beta/citryl-CoA lyase
MSHTLHPLRRPRLQRSTLAVPASNPDMIRKAADSAADVVFLDLEDAVAPPEKPKARANAIAALNGIDWAAKGKAVSVRINGLDTHYMYRDVVDIMEQAGDRLDMILIPKLGVWSDLIETALGMANVEDIAERAAQAGSRLEALHFGVADYAASMRARTVNIGGLNPAYPGDQWHASLTRMIITCRAYGLRALDGPFGDFSDPAGYVAAAERAAALGCEGKWAIHPSQIAMANDVFSPPPAEVTRARRIIEELRKAEAEGKGAAALDGKMIDAASERMALNVIALADAIAAKGAAAAA